MRGMLRAHGLSLAFAALAVSGLACRVAVAAREWDDASGWPAEAVVLWGESWTEMLQFLLAVILTKGLRERGSAESKEE